MTSASNPVSFGSFELDLHSGELRKDGLRIHLGDQPLQVLTLLLEHPGQVVTREELQRKLWSSDTFVEFEHGLNAAVKRLRDALGDSAENPTFIQTLPRHGYRWVAPLNSIDRVTAVPIPDKPARIHPLKRWAFGIVVLFVAVASYQSGGWWRRWQHSSPSIRSVAVLPVVNLSNDPGQEYFCDSMTEALITEMGRLRSLRVISRQSSLHLKGTTKTVSQIARELKVDALVEGCALIEGDKVRISVQLIRAKPEEHLWAQSYERSFRDIMTIQRETSHDIALDIQGTLLRLEERVPSSKNLP